ncbi:hypothetical protein F3W62_06225 [Salmonella enterica]|nr:restriction endonuclease subunit S [Salmonella enterica]EAC0181380.1 restriction endonuclease subunit S [Salmonella enterica subsp. enterica serovar Javiana]EDV2968334.1 hypothetical protein [Salmonella enterica subsp. enterica]EAN8771193.1 restriction endonuclease subunit S [Salmonella enterica]EAO4648943.1 hypothetical protein [Salmonella enterica]
MSSEMKMKKGYVPKLRFPEFQNDVGWDIATVGSKAIKVGSGITPKGGDKNYKKSGRPFIRSQNIGWGHLILDDVAFIDDDTHSTFSSTEIKANDVLLNITGASIGRSAVADSDIQGGNVNQHVCIIRTKKSELKPYFLNQYLLSSDGQKQIDSFQAGGNRQGLNFAQIRSFSFLLPSVKEQQKIADCLSSLDSMISLQTQKIDALQQYKKGLMQKLFPAEGETVPELRFGGFQNEDAWHSLNLGSCLLKRPEYGVNAPAVPFSKELPTYLRITDIAENGSFIHEKKTSVAKSVTDSNYLRKGDIVLARTGASVGKSYLYNEKDGALVFAGFLIRIRPDQKKLNSGFLFQYFKTEKYWKWVSLNSARSGQPGINGSEYSALPIVLPSMQEQQKIADCLSSLDELIVTETQKLGTLKNHKTGLMQQLFPAMDEVNA